MKSHISRREFLGVAGMAVGAHFARPALASALKAPASRVAIGRCQQYNRQVTDVMATMFDQLGGLEKLVGGKTVAIKLNMTGPTDNKLGSMPNQMTHWVHPQVIGSLISLLGNAGARRIRLLESAPFGTKAAGGLHAGRGLAASRTLRAPRRMWSLRIRTFWAAAKPMRALWFRAAG